MWTKSLLNSKQTAYKCIFLIFLDNGGNGLYALIPTVNNNDSDVPDILISDPSGVVESKINSVIPREIYKNYPKTEEERVSQRREFVINMIGMKTFSFYLLSLNIKT